MANKTIEKRLFEALDDNTRYIYGLYKAGNSEYPSEAAINALYDAEREGIGVSMALKEMNAYLPDDIRAKPTIAEMREMEQEAELIADDDYDNLPIIDLDEWRMGRK